MSCGPSFTVSCVYHFIFRTCYPHVPSTEKGFLTSAGSGELDRLRLQSLVFMYVTCFLLPSAHDQSVTVVALLLCAFCIPHALPMHSPCTLTETASHLVTVLGRPPVLSGWPQCCTSPSTARVRRRTGRRTRCDRRSRLRQLLTPSAPQRQTARCFSPGRPSSPGCWRCCKSLLLNPAPYYLQLNDCLTTDRVCLRLAC